jgi:hypothetical protein
VSTVVAEVRRALGESLSRAGWFVVVAVLLMGIGVCLGAMGRGSRGRKE